MKVYALEITSKSMYATIEVYATKEALQERLIQLSSSPSVMTRVVPTKVFDIPEKEG